MPLMQTPDHQHSTQRTEGLYYTINCKNYISVLNICHAFYALSSLFLINYVRAALCPCCIKVLSQDSVHLYIDIIRDERSRRKIITLLIIIRWLLWIIIMRVTLCLNQNSHHAASHFISIVPTQWTIQNQYNSRYVFVCLFSSTDIYRWRRYICTCT